MTQPVRVPGIDAARGAIMLIMAMDHVNALVVRRHSVEFWAGAWTRYGDTLADRLQLGLRLLSDLCAPGFFFWMGSGIALLAARRTDWSAGRLRRHTAVRGVLLVLLSWFVEVPAWLVGIHGNRTDAVPGGWPGAGPAIWLPVTVLTTLGLCTLLLALLRPLSRRPVATACLAAFCVSSPSLFLPDSPISPVGMLARLALVAGQTGGLYVEYPVLPWLGIALFGHLFGQYLVRYPDRTIQASLWIGIACLLLGLALRWHGTFGNLRAPRDGSWREFLNLVKYPPSPVFVLSMLGGTLCLFHCLSRAPQSRLARLCIAFGRAPLAFYLAHLWLFAVIGAVFFPFGTDYAIGLLVWLAGMGLLYPLCTAVARRRGASPASWLHLF
ncbi:MAG: acyltransferase family protein [Gluconacetobacter sp.]